MKNLRTHLKVQGPQRSALVPGQQASGAAAAANGDRIRPVYADEVSDNIMAKSEKGSYG